MTRRLVAALMLAATQVVAACGIVAPRHPEYGDRIDALAPLVKAITGDSGTSGDAPGPQEKKRP